MAQIRSVRCVAQVLFALGAVACGGGDKPANSQNLQQQQCPPGQYFDGQLCQTPGAATGQPQPQGVPATGTPTAGVPTAGTPTVATPPLATSAPGTPAQQLDPTAAAAATQLLGALAQSSAPGAKPVGTAIAGNFQQGQTLETQVQMNPGKCYTVVGAALPTVTNLDIELVPVMPIPGVSPVLAADQTQGSTAVVAPAPNCYKWALPVGAPVKVVLRVSAGQGMAAAQVYEK
ncbi:MAG TPA: hypothetical protein VFQ61_10840 [Polyangiaceae bacterium]|nr:hypothetical protein [Polyangiaceae bacterium]